MVLLGLILLPLLAALVAAVTPSARVRPLIVAGTALLHRAGAQAGCLRGIGKHQLHVGRLRIWLRQALDQIERTSAVLRACEGALYAC